LHVDIIITGCLSLESEGFLSKAESELIAFVSKNSGKLRRSAVKDRDLPLFFVLELLEYLVPVGTTGVRPRLQSRDEISLLLVDEETHVFTDLDGTRII